MLTPGSCCNFLPSLQRSVSIRPGGPQHNNFHQLLPLLTAGMRVHACTHAMCPRKLLTLGPLCLVAQIIKECISSEANNTSTPGEHENIRGTTLASPMFSTPTNLRGSTTSGTTPTARANKARSRRAQARRKAKLKASSKETTLSARGRTTLTTRQTLVRVDDDCVVSSLPMAVCSGGGCGHGYCGCPRPLPAFSMVVFLTTTTTTTTPPRIF